MLAYIWPRIRLALAVVGSVVVVLVVVAVESLCFGHRLLVIHSHSCSVLRVSYQRIPSASVHVPVVHSVVAGCSHRVSTCIGSVGWLLPHFGLSVVAEVLARYMSTEPRVLRSVMMLRIVVV